MIPQLTNKFSNDWTNTSVSNSYIKKNINALRGIYDNSLETNGAFRDVSTYEW